MRSVEEISKVLRHIITICTLYSVCIPKNFKLGCVLVLLLFVIEMIEYKRTEENLAFCWPGRKICVKGEKL